MATLRRSLLTPVIEYQFKSTFIVKALPVNYTSKTGF